MGIVPLNVCKGDIFEDDNLSLKLFIEFIELM